MIFDKDQRELAQKIEEDISISKWKNWKWHIKHSIKDIDNFEKLTGISFSEEERTHLEKTTEKFPLSITPYYLSLINPENYRNDPVFRQAFPDPRELITCKYDMNDPLAEDSDSPVELITHRYPDRVLFHISNVCSMYCRHCTRKRKVGDVDYIPAPKKIKKALEYIRENIEIRDVLLSGGDPLMLSDKNLEWILGELRNIPHVEIIRLGSRMPVVLPYRITHELVEILKKYHPIWFNTHFNHPGEITASSRAALAKLADAGFPLGNQTVLLAEVNDCPRIIKRLVQLLVQNRVRPYYMYQCDLSEGLEHFRTPVSKGIEIMETLRGHTSGFAIPTFVVDAPGGGGKIPINPNYLVSWSVNKVILRNYEGIITSYREPDNYNNICCDLKCSECDLDLNVDPAQEVVPIGLEKLLTDHDETITLIPEDCYRLTRREEENNED